MILSQNATVLTVSTELKNCQIRVS